MPTKKSKKTVKKVNSKKTFKKPVKKASEKTVVVKPVTDSTGVVTMKSVDEPSVASEGKVVKVKAVLDKATGVITMVPVDDIIN